MRKKLVLIVTIMVISVGIVMVMSWFPELYRLGPAEVRQTILVNEDNMVDLIASVPVQMRIRKVKLSHTILSIDLIVTGKTTKSSVYQDLDQIAQCAITGTSNLNRVLVRVFNSDFGEYGRFSAKTLLLSTDIKREDVKALSNNKYDKSSNYYQKLMENKFQITYTSRWSERF